MIKSLFSAGLFLIGFMIGISVGALVERSLQLPHGPWIQSGENRGQGVDRIEAKLNDVWGKGEKFRYEIFAVDDGFFYPYYRNGSKVFYRLVSEANDDYTRQLASAKGIMREVDRQETGL